MTKESNSITLDGLATMVAKGFDNMSTGIAELRDGYSRLDGKVGRIEVDLSTLSKKVDILDTKVGRIDYQLGEVYDIVRGLEDDIPDLKKRVGVLEKTVKTLAPVK